MNKFSILLIYSSISYMLIGCGEVESQKLTLLEYTTLLEVSELETPWGMVFLPDNSILITEKKGQLVHYKRGKKIYIDNVPTVNSSGQGGLLDICLHPDYNKNGWIYLSYSYANNQGTNTAIMRAKLSVNSLVSNEILYTATPATNSSVHFGSRIAFDKDGYLYFSVGDRYNRNVNPQDVTRDGGKIYRLKDDGQIPETNPFYKQLNAKKAVYSYGHRNSQGLVKHPKTGKIWEHEHGPQGGDEINIIQAGKNYGWPVITYGINYDDTIITELKEKEGMEQPIHYWTPSIAPCGMTFVTSDKYPDWQGSLLVGSLKFQYVEQLFLTTDNKVSQRNKLFENIGRVRNIKESPQGDIYIAVEGKGIYKIIAKTKSDK